jgi:hypothetical protein
MKAVKRILTMLLALGVTAGVVFLAANMEQGGVMQSKSKVLVVPGGGAITLLRGGSQSEISQQTELVAGDEIATAAGQTAVIQTGDNAIVRLGTESRLEFSDEDADGSGFVFELEGGRVWVNGIYTTSNINLLAGGAFLVSRMGAFDTTFDGAKTTVRVFVDQVTVGLVKPGVNFTKAVRYSSSSFINSFLMAQGTQADVFLETIRSNEETLRKLLYSKMIKEFKYALFASADIQSDPWVRQNLADDDAFAQKVSKDKLQQINVRGLKIGALDSLAYQLQKSWNGFADVLTFSSDRVRQRVVERIFDQLLDSEYLLIYGRSTEAKDRLSLFAKLVTDAAASGSDDRTKNLILDDLRKSYADLAFVMPDDSLFDVKSTISLSLDQLLGQSDDDLIERFGLIRDYMNYAYRLADTNALLARLTLEKYNTRFIDFTTKEAGNLQRVKNLIAEENEVMDFLLLQYPIFYQDAYFAIKNTLELKWLSLLPEGSDKDEERQTIISVKIDFLKNIQRFFLDEKIALADATKVVSRLINEINDLQPGTELGITQIINQRLKDYGQFLGFLKAASSGSLRGNTMQQKYDSYLASQPQPVQLEQVIGDYISGASTKTPTLTTSDVILQVKKDFAQAGISDLRLGNLTGTDQRIIAVQNASLNNIVFSGDYEWAKGLISNVRSGGAVVSANAVSLSALSGILKPKLVETQQAPETQVTVQSSQTQQVVPRPVQTQQQTQIQTQQTQVSPDLSRSEKVAKILLIQKLKGKDIRATESGITVTSVSDKLFELSHVSLISRPEIIFSFRYDDKTGKAYDVILHTASGDRPVDAEVALDDLVARVVAAYEGTAV